jgi:hypothetical protein
MVRLKEREDAKLAAEKAKIDKQAAKEVAHAHKCDEEALKAKEAFWASSSRL